MSRRQIVVTIDCKSEVCGECKFNDGHCEMAHEEWDAERGPLCLAAERKLKDLVEAGEIAAGFSPRGIWDAWDRALAAMKESE